MYYTAVAAHFRTHTELKRRLFKVTNALQLWALAVQKANESNPNDTRTQNYLSSTLPPRRELPAKAEARGGRVALNANQLRVFSPFQQHPSKAP